MEEIKVNMENLSEEERKQLLSLVEKANDNGKKQKMIDQLKHNYKDFYGDKFKKLNKKYTDIFYQCIESTINNIFKKGYGDLVEIVPSTNIMLWNTFQGNVYMHITAKTLTLATPDLDVEIDNLFRSAGKYSKEYKAYIYLPLYIDLNDGLYKSMWTYRYVGRDEEKRKENIRWE